MKRLAALFVLLLVLPASAHAWWNDEWTVRKKVTLDTQAAGVQGEADFVPLLVRLSTGNFDFLAAKPDGSDIRFVAEDDKTPLKFHIERYDSVNELAFVWVQVPKLAGNNNAQHIWLYYGSEKAQAAGDSKTSYDTPQVIVYHLSDKQGLPQDATAYGNNATQANVSFLPGGLIAGAAKLTGNGGIVAGSTILQSAKEFTFSAWIKPEKPDSELLAYGGLSLNLSAGVPVLALNGAETRAAAPIPMNTWHHIAVTVGQGLTLYVDGKQVATTVGALAPAASLRIGGSLVGEMDEVQVSSVARQAAWIAAQVESQGQAGKLVKYGEDETTDSAAGDSYFATILGSVTTDGWVVIAILGVMFVVAMWVMATKILFLARMEKANETFTEEFGKMSRGLAQLDDSAAAHTGKMDNLAKMMEEFKHSSLYRIYHVGVTELKHRFPSSAGAEGLPVISPQSIAAVRASLDAQLTREGHRLNRSMVWLTIAISGGPFLGLLGTVVGVMITFAAIAAAGDVNVNAIAPGIAAALVATVAGLAVAIPALFGYNYLTSKIKTISADLHVFVDEFVTKMAENYGG